MDIPDLRTFLAVARHGGITRAAVALHTVQSNVTQRIKALEAEVGAPLFARHSRGMTLTPAGHRLVPYASRMTVLMSEALQAAREDGAPKGDLKLGAMETTAAVRLPPLLARFHRLHPAVALSLRTGPTSDLIEAVRRGDLDAAFVAGPVDFPDLAAAVAFEEELVLVTAARWDSLARLRTSFAGSSPTALVFRAGCSYRQRLEQVLASYGWPGATRMEFGTLEGIVGCVAAGMGVSLLPRAVVERSDLRRHVTAHALSAGLARSQTLLVARRVLQESAALLRFRECCASQAAPPSGARRRRPRAREVA